jgi:adenylate cyclase
MSSSILKEDGVIGDFQGDAIMAFWGWPLGEENSIDAALQAAQTILTRMADLSSTLTGGEKAGGEGGFRCGIGIAHGPAVVGRLGTPDQFKIGVFGPTVNLAARLESLTKQWGVSILMDEECALYLARKTVPSRPRYRRLARVQPAGMDLKVNISEVVVGDGDAGHRNGTYEQALKAFEERRWDEARSALTSLLPDGPSSFLLQYVADHPHGPSADWDGSLALKTK